MSEMHAPGPPIEKDWLRAETIAQKLDISVRTLERWEASAKFPKADIRRGAKLKFWRRSTYEEWLRQQGGS